MDAGDVVSNLETVIHRSIISLSKTTRDFLQKEIELTRICRLVVLLKKSGINLNTILFKKIIEKCMKMQRDDGGWSDIPESLWCVSCLSLSNEYGTSVEKAIEWIASQRQENQGWGNSIRDYARIPVTGLILYFLPQLASEKILKWLEREWQKELESQPCLNYKAAFTLMAFGKNDYRPEDGEITSKTINWLVNQQNNDGGWGPLKGHPVGSDPWCTGICLISLLMYPHELNRKTLLNGIEWLKKKQMPNGLWAYHYIEDGSAWALYALTKGYSYLNR